MQKHKKNREKLGKTWEKFENRVIKSLFYFYRDIRERQMRKANAANSLPNAKGSVNNATVVTNTNIARPTTVHATIEKSNSFVVLS